MKSSTKVDIKNHKVDKVVNNVNEMSLSDIIKKNARDRGYTMETLSRLLGYSRGGLSKMMKNNSYKASVVVDLSRLLDISLDTIVNINENTSIEIYGPDPENEAAMMREIYADQFSIGLGSFHTNKKNSKILSRKEQIELEGLLQSITDKFYKKAIEVRQLNKNISSLRFDLNKTMNEVKRKLERIQRQRAKEAKK